MLRSAILCTWVLLTITDTVVGADNIDYAKQIKPIFAEHCYKCHGEKKGLGKLRLHTAEAIAESVEKHANLFGDGNPEESELYERLVLPKDHKKRMPKGGDPLPKDQIDLIAKWIAQGALFAAVASTETTSSENINSEAQASEQKKESLPLPEVSPADEEAIKRLSAAGAQVGALFANSNLLTVSFALSSNPVGDEQIASLPSAAQQIYSLNLAGAKASENGWSPLAQLSNLSQLHLENSSISDSGLASLSGLERLEYLNLYGTGITDNGLKHLEKLKHLQNLYLWQTKVSFDAARKLEKTIPGLEVNLGHDHPEVMRRRLAKDIENTKQQLEATKSEFTQAEAELKSATAAKEQAEKRLAELEGQLKTLDGGPESEEEKAAQADNAPE